MDQENEIAKAKWLLISGVVFLVASYLTYREIVYLFQGHNAEGQVVRVFEVTRHRRSFFNRRNNLIVEYSFVEANGTQRSGSDTVRPSWQYPEDGAVMIRYTPGKAGRSRLAGQVNWFGVVLFAVSVGAMVLFSIRLWVRAAEETRPRRRRDRSE
jgi:hypothetical protein